MSRERQHRLWASHTHSTELIAVVEDDWTLHGKRNYPDCRCIRLFRLPSPLAPRPSGLSCLSLSRRVPNFFQLLVSHNREMDSRCR